jgi:tetratricopeptide repeat protein 7
LEQLTEKQLPSRSLRVVAESFAVHGLALEKVPPALSSKYQTAEKEQRVLKSLETAGDITLLYFQEQDKFQGNLSSSYRDEWSTSLFFLNQGQSNWSITTSGSNSPLPPLNEQRIGLLLETALLRAPLIHIKAGRWNEAISRYR